MVTKKYWISKFILRNFLKIFKSWDILKNIWQFISFLCSINTKGTAVEWKEGNVLFNDTLNTFYLRSYGVKHMVKDHSDSERRNRCRHMGYSIRLAARILLYASSHRQDNTYHGLCYTSLGALAGTRNSSMGPP